MTTNTLPSKPKPALPPQYQAWQSRFQKAQQSANIPDVLGQTQTPQSYVRRAMLLDLAEVLERLREATPATITLLADVLYIPANTNWTISDASVTLIARHLVVEPNASISLDLLPGTSLVLYAQSSDGTLEIFTPRGEALAFRPAALGTLYERGDGDIQTTALETLPAEWLHVTSDLAMLFTAQFAYATVLSGSDRTLAGEIAGWLRRCALQSPDLADLGYQAAALEVALKALSATTTFVPALSKTMYLDLAKAYTDSAAQFEREYLRLSSEQAQVELWQKAGRLWISQQEAQHDFIAAQLEDARRNWNDAQSAVRAAQSTFERHHAAVQELAVSFEAGVRRWIEEQKLKAAWQIIMGVVDVVKALGSLAVMIGGAIATGGASAGAAAAGAGGSAASGAGSILGSAATTGGVMQLKGVADTVAKAAQAGKQSIDLAEVVKKLAEFVEKLNGVMTAVSSLVQSVQSVPGDGKELAAPGKLAKQTFEIPVGLDLSGVPIWEKFRLECIAALEPAITNGIDNAREYRLQLEVLVEYGKALTANQFGLLKAGQELARLAHQQRLAERQSEQLRSYTTDLAAAQAAPQRLQQLVNLRYLDTRRSLFVALQHYCWAYRYWALRPSQLRPTLDRTAAELSTDLGRAQAELNAALQRFNPPPQEFSRVLRFEQPELLGALRQHGEVTMLIDRDHPAFTGESRVRVRRIRVWLPGAASADGRVQIAIRTNGNYEDRLGDELFYFSTDPLQRSFRYRVRPGVAPQIELDGTIDEEQRFAYFMPTPFTAWTIAIPPQQRRLLDLSALSAIELELAGSAIG
ncbi:MAG: hypothetical protein OHK0022_12700 [Roseiflexaceae bacterium]